MEQGPSTVAPMTKPKKKVVRKSFMGEMCTNPECLREFKIEKDYTEYKLCCPYCWKRVESTRILKQQLNKET